MTCTYRRKPLPPQIYLRGYQFLSWKLWLPSHVRDECHAESGFSTKVMTVYAPPTPSSWLRQQPAIDPDRISIIGHSEGADVAPMVADEDPLITFLVLLAAREYRVEKLLR